MSSKRFCSKCGKEIAAETRFCQFCGEPCVSTMQPVIPKVTAHNNWQTLTGLAKIQKCFFSTEGRLNRKRFFLRLLCIAIPSHLMQALISIESSLEMIGLVLLVLLIVSISYVTLLIRRAHDLNQRGSYLFWILVPIYGIYIFAKLLGTTGTAGPNNFGSDPLTISKLPDDLF